MNNNNTKIFRALSDNNRLRILKALQVRMLCVCEIKQLLGLANSTVSQHLKILRNAGFILEEKDGKWVNYHINLNPADKRIGAVLSTLDFWIGNEQLIVSDKKTIEHLDRNSIC